MRKLKALSAFVMTCALLMTLLSSTAMAIERSPKIIFASAGAQDTETEPRAEDAVPTLVPYNNKEEKKNWYDVLEGFFSVSTVYEPAASAAPQEEDDAIRSLFIDNTTFVSLRDFVVYQDARAEIKYSDGKVTVSCEGHYMEFTVGQIYYYVDGRILPLPAPCFERDGCFYVPVRAMATVFSYDVAWSEEAFAATLSENGKRLVPGSEFYDQDDYMLMARLIKAESGNQPLEGKIAVGNVIMNRVRNSSFPNTISDVIYDRSCGIQFTTAYNGALNNTPNEECLVAAKLCLEGYSVTDSSLFFFNPGISSSSWIKRNRNFVVRIGDHVFYS